MIDIHFCPTSVSGDVLAVLGSSMELLSKKS